MQNTVDVVTSIVVPLIVVAFLGMIAVRIWMASRSQRKQRAEWMIEVRRQSDAQERIATALEKTSGHS